jgi:hypothetical protein
MGFVTPVVVEHPSLMYVENLGAELVKLWADHCPNTESVDSVTHEVAQVFEGFVVGELGISEVAVSRTLCAEHYLLEAEDGQLEVAPVKSYAAYYQIVAVAVCLIVESSESSTYLEQQNYHL